MKLRMEIKDLKDQMGVLQSEVREAFSRKYDAMVANPNSSSPIIQNALSKSEEDELEHLERELQDQINLESSFDGRSNNLLKNEEFKRIRSDEQPLASPSGPIGADSAPKMFFNSS